MRNIQHARCFLSRDIKQKPTGSGIHSFLREVKLKSIMARYQNIKLVWTKRTDLLNTGGTLLGSLTHNHSPSSRYQTKTNRGRDMPLDMPLDTPLEGQNSQLA